MRRDTVVTIPGIKFEARGYLTDGSNASLHCVRIILCTDQDRLVKAVFTEIANSVKMELITASDGLWPKDIIVSTIQRH